MKKIKYVVWFILLIALAISVLTTYVLLQQRDNLKQNLENSVATDVRSEIQSIPLPKDGMNGQNATPQQISQAVTSYFATNPVKNGQDGHNATPEQIQQAVDNYFESNPVKNGTDGKDGTNGQNGSDGLDGKTPQIRCNIVKNRWEVRYSDTENWQALNGQTVKCTLSTE